MYVFGGRTDMDAGRTCILHTELGANSLLMKVKIKEYFLFSKWILYFKHALVFCAQRSCIYYEFHVMLANAAQGSPAVSLVSGHNLKHRRQFYIISLRFSDVSVLFSVIVITSNHHMKSYLTQLIQLMYELTCVKTVGFFGTLQP